MSISFSFSSRSVGRSADMMVAIERMTSMEEDMALSISKESTFRTAQVPHNGTHQDSGP